MATRCQFENSNEVGVFAKLTNAYCLVALGGSENFYRYVQALKQALWPQWVAYNILLISDTGSPLEYWRLQLSGCFSSFVEPAAYSRQSSPIIYRWSRRRLPEHGLWGEYV